MTIFCQAENPVFANERLVVVHTATGGRQKTTLPFRCDKVIDVFGGNTVAENVVEFEYDFSVPDTVLFEMQRTTSKK